MQPSYIFYMNPTVKLVNRNNQSPMSYGSSRDEASIELSNHICTLLQRKCSRLSAEKLQSLQSSSCLPSAEFRRRSNLGLSSGNRLESLVLMIDRSLSKGQPVKSSFSSFSCFGTAYSTTIHAVVVQEPAASTQVAPAQAALHLRPSLQSTWVAGHIKQQRFSKPVSLRFRVSSIKFGGKLSWR